MKTTIEISEPLLERVRSLAARESSTLRALVEEGLRCVVERREQQKPPFRLRRVSFGGDGVSADFREDEPDRIRDAAYEGRGG